MPDLCPETLRSENNALTLELHRERAENHDLRRQLANLTAKLQTASDRVDYLESQQRQAEPSFAEMDDEQIDDFVEMISKVV